MSNMSTPLRGVARWATKFWNQSTSGNMEPGLTAAPPVGLVWSMIFLYSIHSSTVASLLLNKGCFGVFILIKVTPAGL